MDKKTQIFAKKQADDHAEFMAEYTRYIYQRAHFHGFKHGYEYAAENTTSDYLKACHTIVKDFNIDTTDTKGPDTKE